MDKLVQSVKGPYLCAEYITIGDLVMWSHFWKLIHNEESELPRESLKDIICRYPRIHNWAFRMQQDMADIYPKL